ncbi:MAG: hypothetical protein WD295_03950 [Bacteroidota bacterium]
MNAFAAKRVNWLAGCLLLLLAFGFTTGMAQNQVELDLNFPSYDVIYLSDFLDVTTGKLATSIPNISLEMRPLNPPLRIYLRFNASIQLRGDSRPEELIMAPGAETTDFDLAGGRRISSRELSGTGAQDIDIRSGFQENGDLRKRLENHAMRFPTAPVGTYIIRIEAFSASNRGQLLGAVERRITVQNTSTSEVQVSLIDPQPGAILQTPFPTFSWSSQKPEVTLYVYERLPIHRSPQEAITGIPYLKQDLTGGTTFTYPANAPRRLEQNKSYYWFVETSVTTNRGVEKRQSEIRLFRVRMDNSLAQSIEWFFNTLGGDAAGALNSLLESGWTPTGNMTLDGRPITREDLNALLNLLQNRIIQYSVRVESH